MIQSNVTLDKKQHKILNSKTRDLQIQITVIQIKHFEQLGPSLAQACEVLCYSSTAVDKAKLTKPKDILNFWLILYCYTDNRFIIKSNENCIKLDDVPVIKNKAKILL